jgi:hypothetical protein
MWSDDWGKAPRTGDPVRCGWFAGDPKNWPLEYERKLIWRRNAWHAFGRLDDLGDEWTPTHWWKPTVR